MKDLRRFQAEKEDDLRRYMVRLAHHLSPSLELSANKIPDGVCSMSH
jgi:hypothetical protein